MAEGLLRSLGGPGVEVFSAGTTATSVRPEAIAVMGEIGINIAHRASKSLEPFLGESFDAVITVCDDANDACPVFPGAKERRHWSIADPSRVEGTAAERLAAFRQARDDLRQRIETELLGESGT